jgi:hypothetical protein
MNEPSKRCDRCRDPIDEVAARVAIESGPLHELHPLLDLCAACSESLERWFARRGRGRPSRGAGGGFREHSHRHGDDDSPAAMAGELGSGTLFLQGDQARQILLTVIVVAIFALSVTFFVAIMR